MISCVSFSDIYINVIRIKVPLHSPSPILQLSVSILTAPVVDSNGSFHNLFLFEPLHQALCLSLPQVIKLFAHAKNWFKRVQVWSPQLFLWPDRTRELTHLWMQCDLIQKHRCTEYFLICCAVSSRLTHTMKLHCENLWRQRNSFTLTMNRNIWV